MNLELDLFVRLCKFLNFHERSYIEGTTCTICANYKSLKILDKDIDENLIKNYCKSDKQIIDKIVLKKLTNKSQRIHVIGDIWPLINSLKHRKFSFFSKQYKANNKDSICITDTNNQIEKYDNKLIISQGYSKEYNLSSVDYLLIENKHIDSSFEIPFDKEIIPEKGYLIIDLNGGEKFYSE